MPIENIYTANCTEPKESRELLKPGLYICYHCMKGQKVTYDGILRYCDKCGSSQFFQQ